MANELQAVAKVMTSDKKAALVIYTNQEGVAGTMITISGQAQEYSRFNGSALEDHYHNQQILPSISVAAVMHAVNSPKAKHATFNKKGNGFSRIAHLVQCGYQGTFVGSVEPQHSGVVFRWTEKDLHKYVQKWVKNITRNTQIGGVDISGQREKLREAPITVLNKVYYNFVDDEKIVVMAPDQRKREEEAQKEADRYARSGKTMVNILDDYRPS